MPFIALTSSLYFYFSAFKELWYILSNNFLKVAEVMNEWTKQTKLGVFKKFAIINISQSTHKAFKFKT